jgi:hypothetical protein
MGFPDGYNCDLPLGETNADNACDSSLVVANANGSVLERLEYVQQNMNGTGVVYNAPNYLAVPIAMVVGTTGAVGQHETFTVTGAVRMKMLIECTDTLTDAGNGATIQFGVAGATDLFIAASDTDLIATGEAWCDATPTETAGAYSTLVLDKVVMGGIDVGYEVAVEAITGGTLIFHCWWEPLNATGAVVAAAGATGAL